MKRQFELLIDRIDWEREASEVEHIPDENIIESPVGFDESEIYHNQLDLYGRPDQGDLV